MVRRKIKRNKKGQFIKSIKKSIKRRLSGSRVSEGARELKRYRLERQTIRGSKRAKAKARQELKRMDWQDYYKRKREYKKNKRDWDLYVKYT